MDFFDNYWKKASDWIDEINPFHDSAESESLAESNIESESKTKIEEEEDQAITPRASIDSALPTATIDPVY